ncbi:hypothetical protein BC835DRAFT_1340033 [Cytidiella melzeri]|nr:hypothetical protein BC835DRAFT_1340033 [Cytidiella melzeri]
MAVSPNPVFKFAGQMYAVKVENVPSAATQQEIVKLFSALIGDVRRCDEFVDDMKRRVIELEFPTSDAAKKALCMTGYTVSGVQITVSPAGNIVSCRQPKEAKHSDGRRNLYVLGLPFDLTKSDFVDIFSRYGNVAHAVILATVDNASRRRGFVVMATHREAKLAMDALSRREIKGHTIDVSWAVVQRSQGFLDGGDRTLVLSQQAQNTSSTEQMFDSHTMDLACTSETSGPARPAIENQIQQITPVPSPVPALLVTNLPSVLFSQVTDLHPLLCPFGEIVDLKIVSENCEEGTVTVFVEYKTASQAQEALDMLRGQRYTSQPVHAQYVQPNRPPVDSDLDGWPRCKFNAKTGLNPLAAPFLAERAYAPSHLAPPLMEGLPNPTRISRINVASVVTRNNSPFLEASALRSDMASSSDLYGLPFVTHRPRSAPSDITGLHLGVFSGLQACSNRNMASFASTSLRSSFTA